MLLAAREVDMDVGDSVEYRVEQIAQTGLRAEPRKVVGTGLTTCVPAPDR